MDATTYGVDIAKSVMRLRWLEAETVEIKRKMLPRAKLGEFFARRQVDKFVEETWSCRSGSLPGGRCDRQRTRASRATSDATDDCWSASPRSQSVRRQEILDRRDSLLFQIKASPSAALTVTRMNSDSFPRPWYSSPDQPLAAGTIFTIIEAARRLRAVAHVRALGKVLSGKNLALLMTVTGQETSDLKRAAQELDARVSELRFVETEASMRRDLASMARLLGRMYDAIDCGALTPSRARLIELESGVPVYAGLGEDDHPARVMADLMTLCDYQHPSAPESTVLFFGDAETRRGCAFEAAAREMGFIFRAEDHARAAPNESAFLVDATHPPHWSLRGPTTPIDEARRSANHRFVMQAVLIETIAGA